MAEANEVSGVQVEVAAPARSRLAKLSDWLGNPWGYLLVVPAVVLYAIFEIWPIVRGLMMAFSPYSWVLPETKGLLIFNGLENYRELLGSREWRHSMWVSVKFTVAVLPTNFLLAMFTAVMISKVTSPKWSAFFRMASYLPVVLPISSAMLLWQNLYASEYGYINHFLKTLFKVAEPPSWTGDYRWTLLAAAIPTVWRGFGHNTLLFLMGIYSINRELYEAAQIDGANEWQQFWKVTLPLLKPIIVLVLVLSAGLVSATAELMVFYGGGTRDGAWTPEWGGPFQAALTAGLYTWMVAFGRPDMRMGLAASASLILGLISMVLSAVVFKAVRVERV